MKKKIFLDDLKVKLNKDKAFPVYKKKVTNEDLKLVFTDQELKKKSVIKKYTLIFSIFILITGFFSVDIVRMIVGCVFLLISLLMEDPNKKFLKERIKKSPKHLISAFDHGLVDFYLMGGIGTISRNDTQLVEQEQT